MAATYMLRKHLAVRSAASRPEAIRENVIDCEASNRARDELSESFPIVTAENFEKANAFLRERIDFWRQELRKVDA